jgi:hypothetical protein
MISLNFALYWFFLLFLNIDIDVKNERAGEQRP